MKQRLLSSFLHILVFVVIEIAFVFIILHEFPEISFFEELWFIHLSYWVMIFLAWYLRESLKWYKIRFLATYLPVLFHVFWHLYIWHETVELIWAHSHGSEFWLIISTVVLWIFIFLGEYLLHKKYHCDSHHESLHKHCDGK